MIKNTLILIFLSLLLTGCQTLVAPKPAPISINVPSIASSGAGISGGGLVGGVFGADLNAEDRQLAVNAEYKALEYGKVGVNSQWAGSNGSTSGKVVAAQPYRVGSQDCRQYSHEILVGGVSKRSRATACRNNDGSWSLLE